MNLLTQAPELFRSSCCSKSPIGFMSGRSNRCTWPPAVQTRAINQSNQDDRVSGPFGVGFHRGAVDEALLKIIQPLLDNITQLHLMNQSTGLVAHRVEVVAEGTGGRQLEPQMFQPESERDRLFQQQPGVLVFAAAVETSQHQEKIDDIGIGAGSACLQLNLID